MLSGHYIKPRRKKHFYLNVVKLYANNIKLTCSSFGLILVEIDPEILRSVRAYSLLSISL